MAKGFDRHQARVKALTHLGRALARRSGSRCDLCETSGVRLEATEVPPLPDEPELDRCVFICETCRDDVTGDHIRDARHWRCLENTAWSEIPAVQVNAVRLLRRLEKSGELWAEDLLESLYISEEVQSWLDGGA